MKIECMGVVLSDDWVVEIYQREKKTETKKKEKETVTDDSDVNDKRTIMFRT